MRQSKRSTVLLKGNALAIDFDTVTKVHVRVGLKSDHIIRQFMWDRCRGQGSWDRASSFQRLLHLANEQR